MQCDQPLLDGILECICWMSVAAASAEPLSLVGAVMLKWPESGLESLKVHR